MHRRKDRRVISSGRICSCHFKDGRKENGPTLFPWNQGTYFDFPNPNKISRQCRQTEIGESAEPETNEGILTDTEPVVENEVADEEHYYMQSYSSLVQCIRNQGTGEADNIFADRNSKSSVTEAPFNSCKCHRQ